ncbi:MAG: STAS domain-containing protein [Spirochaetes bacterium]|nr:STAS domain-containing protein [Spirochaetota bacterium]MBU0955129.1 STAS domain-containing protein [Spirochaetota bacterium]
MKDTSRLVFSGALTIEKAADIAGQLKKALAASAQLSVDVSEVTDLDLPVLQVLYAAARSAEKLGGSLVFEGRLQDDTCRKLATSGFVREKITVADQLIKQLPDFPVSGQAS